ncbi:aldo/keto reductase [Chitinophaga sp. MM2321]|uniref:aldo/keto reductase n=1 Tax=Chitinophaga sp. MM2321 TaxID=3137178 RepID=UPI0032D5AA35
MEYINVHGYTISRLTLGTVALGLDYGISNNKGKPAPQESFEIMSCALAAGINTLDTAGSYGNAEQLIGSFLDQWENRSPVNVVTKFKIKPEHLLNRNELNREIIHSVRSSLHQLKLQRISVCLLHMDSSLPMDQVAAILPSLLHDLKAEGLIDIGGVSVDHPDEVSFFLDHPEIQAFQVPVNIFDHRLINNGLLQRMQQKNKIVFARSVFLQGLFFMSADQLTGNLVKAKAYINALHDLAGQADMSIAQLAFSYVRDLPGITSIVFGAVSVGQVMQNAGLLQGGTISMALRENIRILFAEMPEDILIPALWSK